MEKSDRIRRGGNKNADRETRERNFNVRTRRKEGRVEMVEEDRERKREGKRRSKDRKMNKKGKRL